MKKNLTLLLAIGAFSGSMYAQIPVSTTPSNKKVVLEEFTGIKCQYCPDGHKIANIIKASKPFGDVVLINIHTGGYANPVGNEPDYRTNEGNAIVAMPGMGLTGYPQGSLNRMVMTPTAIACNRNTWTGHANTILGQTSPVNVALQGTLNVVTRVLTVVAEVYYTGNSATPQNSLTIALLENNVVGPQTSGAIYNPTQTNPDGSYNHQHMLRKVLTAGNFGITVPNTTTGSTFSTSVNYTIPTLFGAGTFTNPCNLGQVELVAFVAEDQAKIQTAAYGPITLTGFANTLDAGLNNITVDAEVCLGKFNTPSFKFTNNGGNTITNAVFSYQVNGGAPVSYTWTGNATPLTITTVTLSPIVFTPGATTNSMSVNVITVNGGADQNSANNIVVQNVPTTTYLANNLNMQMDFTQDRYGSESSWQVIDETTNAVVSSDGPFADLAANGILLNTKIFTINPSNCYILKVKDTFGDGINSGYGVGGFILKSGTTNMITSNGIYGSGVNNWYKSGLSTGINSSNVSYTDVSIFPNPSNGEVNISLVNMNSNTTVSIVNTLGQVVSTKTILLGSTSTTIEAGTLAVGLYNVVINSQEGSVVKKLTIVK